MDSLPTTSVQFRFVLCPYRLLLYPQHILTVLVLDGAVSMCLQNIRIACAPPRAYRKRPRSECILSYVNSPYSESVDSRSYSTSH